jgi:polyisoprenyl-teichoic acid--peptidoglycan teichoic acid transferase
MTRHPRLRRAWHVVVLGLLTALFLPPAGVRPPALSLHAVETAKGVDFSGGELWVLVLGADSEGLTDAIHLVGIDGSSGSAVGLGIPRDAWLDMPGVGRARINEAYAHPDGGPEFVARVVRDLTGITPDLVLHLDSDGFRSLLATVGAVDVRTPEGFTNDGVRVRRGLNTFTPAEALAYVGYRVGLARSDFDRSANQQRLMLGALTTLRAREDRVGFMERATLAALGSLDTDLGPGEMYRLAQFVTTVDPRRADSCVITGTLADVGPDNASVVIVDPAFAHRIGADAADDLRLQRGCPSA